MLLVKIFISSLYLRLNLLHINIRIWLELLGIDMSQSKKYGKLIVSIVNLKTLIT